MSETKEDQQSAKNAVFSAQEAARQAVAQSGGAVEGVSKEQFAKEQLGIEIPVNAVPLPSKGSVYAEDHPLFGAESVEYTSMTAREEDILMSQALIKKGTVINELIKSCLINKAVNVTSLLSGDRNALMIAVRASGYGAVYDPTFMCPACEHKNTLQVNLSDLPIKQLEIEPATPGKNEFEYTLPNSQKKVLFRFLTGHEEEQLLNQMNAKKKKGILNSNLVTARLLASIVAVDGNRNQSQIAKFVQYMPAIDSLALRQYIDDNEPGVDMKVDFECMACEHVDEIVLPMGPSFFWPNASR